MPEVTTKKVEPNGGNWPPMSEVVKTIRRIRAERPVYVCPVCGRRGLIKRTGDGLVVADDRVA